VSNPFTCPSFVIEVVQGAENAFANYLLPFFLENFQLPVEEMFPTSERVKPCRWFDLFISSFFEPET
jgi:hypothetical protein